jgi:alginate O-acetyltransferase complex protein AlgI
MLFNSFQFLLFFPIVTTLYYVLPHRFRWFMLLAASCYFYMAFVPEYILILALTIVVDYAAGIYIERSTGKRRKLYLIVSIVVTCFILFVFKYINFFNDNARLLYETLGFAYPIERFNILLPIGLSFHTFQSLSYVIEVYRGNQKAEKHFGIYSLYVMFYPQLVAGPIERPQNILHQFHEVKKLHWDNLVIGGRLILWGLFKKVVIADRVAVFANLVFDNPEQYAGFQVLIGVFFFTIQIYCDFSGYSDIAIGTARVMGFDLMQNFNYPYFSTSITEFWRRWHVSLSTWFRDYVYIPLGGSANGSLMKYRNLLITFAISGLWHGASWNFIIWGVYHGIWLVIEGIFKVPRVTPLLTLKGMLRWVVTFAIVMGGWVFFRAKTFTGAIDVFAGLPNLSRNQLGLYMFGDYSFELAMCFVSIAMLFVVDYFLRFKDAFARFDTYPRALRWGVYYVLILFLAAAGVYHQQAEFIYFQF